MEIGTDLEGIENVLGDRNTTSLYIVIIYFLIYTGCNNGFSRVISLCVVYLTKLESVIVYMRSAGVTVKF
jgi:hypothetical protein